VSRKQILLVDDEENIREVASMSIELTHDWEVTTACNGKDALAKAVAVRPDVILLDVMMPEMDGPTTVAALRSRPETRSVPVILLTAKVQAADKRRFTQLDIQGVMAKPFDPMTLASEIASIMQWEN
jgi:CheY-like chemotaxis protein